MNLELIKKTLDSGAGKSMKTYLISKLNELKDIDSINEKDTEKEQALETKSQKRAYNKLKEILQEIMTFSQGVTKLDPRDSFGITDEDIK